MSDPNRLQEIKLGQIGKFSTSSVDKKSVEGQAQVNLINYMDVYNGNIIDSNIEFMRVSASAVEKTRSQVFCGDILFTPSSETPEDIGHSAVVAEELTDTLHSYHTVRLRPYSTDTLDIRFSAWFANAAVVRKQFSQKCAGSTRYTLSIPAFESVICKIPKSLSVQRRIAGYLDTVQAAIEKTEALIHKYQQIKAGLMHDLFTRGLTADGKLRPPREQAPELYQETPIGWIPKEWQAKKLKDILIETGGYLQTGPFGSQLHAHEYSQEGVPVVMPQDINDGKVGIFDIARIPEKRAQVLHRHRLKIGDIIIARRGELSRAAAITEIEQAWVCGTGCFLLRLGGSKLDTRFFSYAYRHDVVQRQVAGLAVGTTMPSLNNAVMNALYFPYVGINEQNQISEKLELIEKQIETMVKQKAKLNKQKSGLMHDLLTGKVPVKIDQEEPAHG